jgi:ribose transport system ATP-binding protein
MTTTAPQPTTTGTAVLSLRGLSKSFGPVQAVKDLSLDIAPNEVVGLVGENGAGKSTLLKILTGVHQPDAGVIESNGRTVRFRRPVDSVAAGIGVVHQEQSLLTNLSVAENIAMNQVGDADSATRYGLYRWRRLYDEATEVLARVGAHIDPRAKVGDLSFVDRQMVEIARALRVGDYVHAVPLVILDEPTSVLERNKTEILEREIVTLRDSGSVIFVSHRLDEVLRICDRIVVMRDGRVVADRPAGSVTEAELFQLMIGHESRSEARRRSAEDEALAPVLSVEGLRRRGTFKDVSFTVRPGRCVSIVGTVGSGRESVCRALAGVERFDAGTLEVRGESVRGWSIRRALRAGISYVPAERKTEGMVGGLSAAANLSLAHPRRVSVGPFISPRRRTRLAREWFARLGVRPSDPGLPLGRFSGGNQQKVVMASRLLDDELSVLVLDHPLRGLDPGAAETVNEQIVEATHRGTAVVLLPDTLEEALALSDEVLVMRDGEVTARYDLAVESPTSVDLLERMV